jgi:hypothetical protein
LLAVAIWLRERGRWREEEGEEERGQETDHVLEV